MCVLSAFVVLRTETCEQTIFMFSITTSSLERAQQTHITDKMVYKIKLQNVNSKNARYKHTHTHEICT